MRGYRLLIGDVGAKKTVNNEKKKDQKHLRSSVHTCVSGNLLVATVFCRYCEYVTLLGCVTALLRVLHTVFQTMLQGGKRHTRILKPYAFLFFFIDSCMYNVMRKFVRSSEPNEMFVSDCEFCSLSIFLSLFYFLKSFRCFVSYEIAALTSLLSILLYETCMEDRIDEYTVVSAFWLHVPPAEIRAC